MLALSPTRSLRFDSPVSPAVHAPTHVPSLSINHCLLTRSPTHTHTHTHTRTHTHTQSLTHPLTHSLTQVRHLFHGMDERGKGYLNLMDFKRFLRDVDATKKGDHIDRQVCACFDVLVSIDALILAIVLTRFAVLLFLNVDQQHCYESFALLLPHVLIIVFPTVLLTCSHATF